MGRIPSPAESRKAARLYGQLKHAAKTGKPLGKQVAEMADPYGGHTAAQDRKAIKAELQAQANRTRSLSSVLPRGPTTPLSLASGVDRKAAGYAGLIPVVGGAAKKALTSSANLAQELAGMGPGVAQLGYGLATHPVPTAEQFVRSGYHSYGQTFNHPLRQAVNDPLGLIGNVALVGGVAGKVAGTAAGLSRAASVGDVGRALVRSPAPVERTLRIGGDETTKPLGSKNYAVGLAQRHLIDPVTQHALDNPTGRLARTLNTRHFGPEVKVGRELRAQKRFEDASSEAQLGKLSRYGAARKARRTPEIGTKSGKKLSAAQQKAVLIHASGRTPKEFAKLEQAAIDKGIGNKGAQETQLHLTKLAAQYLEPKIHPLVAQAIRDSKAAIAQRESLRGMTEDQIHHRLGAHSLQIEHGAGGFEGESHLDRLERLHGEVQGYTPQKGVSLLRVRAHTEQRLTDLAKRGVTTGPEVLDLKAKLEDIGTHERIAQLHDEITAEGKRVAAKGGFYLPMQDELRPISGRPRSATASPQLQSIGPAKGEKTYPYGGKLVRSGTYRTNATQLAAQALRSQLKLDSAKRWRDSVYRQAKATKAEAGGDRWAVPVRPKTTVPPSLKQMLNAIDRGHVSPEEGDAATLKALEEHWFNPVVEPGEKVRWIDSRRLKPQLGYEPMLGKIGEGLDRTNQVFRFGRFLTPAYAKWIPQNLVFNLVQQGPMVIRNLHSLLREVPKLSPEDYDRIASEAGSGPSLSLSGDTPFLRQKMAGAAHRWHMIDDHLFRMLSWLHEAHRLGFKNAGDWSRLLHEPALKQKMIAISRRSNKEAGDYAITNAERATLKKVFTAWPWITAASRWTARLPVEHPFQSYLYGQQGGKGRKEIQDFFAAHGGIAPSYLRASIPGAGGFAYDTSFLNPAETPGKLMGEVRGMLPGGTPERGTVIGELAPMVNFVRELVLGQTKHGQADPTGLAAFKDLAKTFAPAGVAGTLMKKGGVTAGGPQAAIERALGSPRTKVDFAKAATQGESDYLASLDSVGKVQYRAQKDIRSIPDTVDKYNQKYHPNGGGISEQEIAALHKAIPFAADVKVEEIRAAKAHGVKISALTAHDRATVLDATARKHGYTPQQASGLVHFAFLYDKLVNAMTKPPKKNVIP